MPDVGGNPKTVPVRDFTRLGTAMANFQGGGVLFRGYGCSQCGQAFWTESGPHRELDPGRVVPCPHCSLKSTVPDV